MYKEVHRAVEILMRPGQLLMTLNRACLITLHSNFEIFQKGRPAVEVILDQRIFER